MVLAGRSRPRPRLGACYIRSPRESNASRVIGMITEDRAIDAMPAARPLSVRRWSLPLAVAALLIIPHLMSGALQNLIVYPSAWVVPFNVWVRDGINWLANDLSFKLFTFKDVTRSISVVLSLPFSATKAVLVDGIVWSGSSSLAVPPLSWLGILIVGTMTGLRIGGFKLAALVGISLAYFAAFGLWQSAMTTLASILVAVPFGIAGGVAIGILAYRRPRVATAIEPLLDVMQTLPIFAYLVPVLIFFGFGPVAALTATVVYALPPMSRITTAALQQVPKEVREAGVMAGCTERQLFEKVLLPSAQPSLLVGVNQVIMLSLTVVIVASMIGAGGPGYDVLIALRQLSIGRGLEAGLAITLMAIALDRLSQEAARLNARRSHPPAPRRPRIFGYGLLAILLFTTLLGVWFRPLAVYPESLSVTTAPFWDGAISWINVNLYDTLNAFKYAIIVYLMLPVKQFFAALPWFGVILSLSLLGFVLRGWKLAVTVALLGLCLAVSGNWGRSMITVYLVVLGVALSFLIGFPIGLASAYSERLRRIVQVVIDTLQTLPSFVYLIPAVMLFQNGDFAALIAIVAYAVVPSIRYTDHGVRMISKELVEAAKMVGSTRWQILTKVTLPTALPTILLGINQTVMLALSMLIITALVGTNDLGQEVLNALQKADPGRGLVAGLCVSFIAIILDRLLRASAERLEPSGHRRGA